MLCFITGWCLGYKNALEKCMYEFLCKKTVFHSFQRRDLEWNCESWHLLQRPTLRNWQIVPFYIPVSSVYNGSDFSACSSPLINVCLGDYFEGFWVSHIAQGSHWTLSLLSVGITACTTTPIFLFLILTVVVNLKWFLVVVLPWVCCQGHR